MDAYVVEFVPEGHFLVFPVPIGAVGQFARIDSAYFGDQAVPEGRPLADGEVEFDADAEHFDVGGGGQAGVVEQEVAVVRFPALPFRFGDEGNGAAPLVGDLVDEPDVGFEQDLDAAVVRGGGDLAQAFVGFAPENSSGAQFDFGHVVAGLPAKGHEGDAIDVIALQVVKGVDGQEARRGEVDAAVFGGCGNVGGRTQRRAVAVAGAEGEQNWDEVEGAVHGGADGGFRELVRECPLF